MNERDECEVDSNSVNYTLPGMPSDWRFLGANFADPPLVPSNDPVQTPWDRSISNNVENAGFGCIDARNVAGGSSSMAMNSRSSILKEALFLPNAPRIAPHGLPQFPVDSGFIEPATQFSYFSTGNFSALMNDPFGVYDSTGQCSRDGGVIQGPRDAFVGTSPRQSHKNELNVDKTLNGHCPVVEQNEAEVNPIKNYAKSRVLARSDGEAKQHGLVSGNEQDDAEFTFVNNQEELSNLDGATGEPSKNGLNAKKRKRIVQGILSDQSKAVQENGEASKDNAEEKQIDEQNPRLTANQLIGKKGKQGSQASDSPNKEYIHVRARRGQATNNHSLAERVRRERISERMKLLQDLVPGCNKVTGKAVMLDEIINYVQSLQRQVEFLSMKLATVNPRLDFSIEPRPLSGLAFLQDLPMSDFNPPCFLRRSINSELPSLNVAMGEGFKEPLPGVWEDELHNVVHMNSGSVSPGHMKVER